tara:strand:+ start:155 stop:793 length:639 start_codon:yes stop_codon:yes gene_type:complete
MIKKLIKFSGLLASVLFFITFILLFMNFSSETIQIVKESNFSLTALNIKNMEFLHIINWVGYILVGLLSLIASINLIKKSKNSKTNRIASVLIMISCLLWISCGLTTFTEDTSTNILLIAWLGAIRPVTILGLGILGFVIYFNDGDKLFTSKHTKTVLLIISFLILGSGFIQMDSDSETELIFNCISWALYYLAFIIISFNIPKEKTNANNV